MSSEKMTLGRLQQKKIKGEKITMMTAYDYSAASLVDQAGILANPTQARFPGPRFIHHWC